MGDPDQDWCLSELRGLGRDDGIALLDRAAEVGLLTAYGDGYYSIHPAVPWFFTDMFDRYYPGSSGSTPDSRAKTATRAFVEAIGALGNYYHHQYHQGNHQVTNVIAAEEANLLHAHRLALANGWWGPVIGTMQGLKPLHDHRGRHLEWKQLVDTTAPCFADPETGGPIPGREAQWRILNGYRVRLAERERRFDEAIRLQTLDVKFERQIAATALELESAALTSYQRNNIRSLSVSLSQLADLQRELGSSDCIDNYKEGLGLAERISDRRNAALDAYNLGLAYKDVPDVRDLDEAEHWLKHSLDLRADEDRMGRSACACALGNVELERYEEARKLGRQSSEINEHLQEALCYHMNGLKLTPEDAVANLAVTHNQLGYVYGEAGDLRKAREHYDKSVSLKEKMGDHFGAAQTQVNFAIDLANAGSLRDALTYANAALTRFETYGERAAEKIEKTKGVIAKIKELMEKKEGGGDG